MLSNYSVIDLPSESYMVLNRRYMDPWQYQQPAHRLKTSQSAHRLPMVDRANLGADTNLSTRSVSLSSNKKKNSNSKRQFENKPDVLNTSQLPPSMLRSRSSSVTSNDCLPTPSSASNDHTSMYRQASSESAQVARPPSVATILSLLPPRRPSTQPQPSPAAAAVAATLYGTPLPQQRPHGIKHSLKTLVLSTTTTLSKKRREANVYEWPYVLGQDHQEQDRLVAQHYLLRMAFGGDFAATGAVPLLERNAVVLDVGCGPGAWTMEMATQFPKATFIGIDQAASFPQDIKPKNCHFRQFHIGNGFLPFPDKSVDYIFQRDLNWGLTIDTWKVLVKEYMRILKPGGWIELVEPDLETQSSLCDECAMNDKLLQGMLLRNQDPHMARHLSTLLAVNGFRRVESKFQSLPLGWDVPLTHNSSSTTASFSSLTASETHKLVERMQFARATESQYLFLLQSLRPWLSLVMNISTEKYNSYVTTLPESWRAGQTYVNWHCATAQKPPMGCTVKI